MVSLTPNTQSYLYNHMAFCTDYNDLCGKTQMCKNKNSIYGFLSSDPKFSKFKKIVDNAQMMGFLDSDQANCTLFVPSDNYLEKYTDNYITNMDDGDARHIISSSTIPKILAKDLITSSPVCYLYTRNPKMRMYVTNINSKTKINNCANVVEYDIWCDNGIIHIIDNLLQPSQDHFMN